MKLAHRIVLCGALVVVAPPVHAEDGPRFGVIKLGAKLLGLGGATASPAPATASSSAPAAPLPPPAPLPNVVPAVATPAPAAIPAPAVVPPAQSVALPATPVFAEIGPVVSAPTFAAPTPRLRPAVPGTLLAAAPAAVPLRLPPVVAAPPASPASAVVMVPVTATAMGTRIDPVVTGAIGASHDAPTVAAPRVVDPSITPPPVPSGAPVAAAPPAATVAVSDGLLGDPAASFPATDSRPQAPSPQTIPFARPASPEASGEAPPLVVGTEPYQLVRELQALQDRTATGSVDALSAQRTVIASIDRALAAAPASVWQDARNAVAAIGFVLSGGPPRILRALATAEPKPAVDENLLKGVLAYAEGRESEAYGFLTPLDATSLPPSIGAQVAMAQSALAVRTDPQQAMRLLAVSRLLAPGTLVEEAAIRRQIFVADQLRDYTQVQSLARQYLDRFRRSVYAGNFRERFAAALSHMDFINDPAQFPRLDDMLASVEPDARAELYLTIALASVTNGRLNAARLAATRAVPLTPAGSVGQARARLYRAAVTVASAKTFDAGVEDYQAIDRTRLSATDLQLADAVSVAIAAVRSGTEVSAAKAAPSSEPEQPSAVITRATDAMKRADEILKAASR